MSPNTSRAVLITGCSSGIGRATAERLAKKGHPVYATARRPESIADLAEAGCELLPCDVTDDASMQDVVRRITDAHGAVGALVNNAGYGQEGPVEEIPMDVARRQMETNVFGAARLAQLALPGMRKQGGGRIVNVSSMGGKLTLPGGGWYHASKHALEALSDALRFEVAGFGIRVVVIEPGPIKTRFGDTASASIGEASNGGPYASFNEALASKVKEAYEGWMSAFAAPPEAVAKVIDRAISSRRPRSRYRVTMAARSLLAMRKLLPDAAFDAFLTTQFPRPRA